MKIRVLGSAAGGGFPQWNCNCPNCAGVRSGTLRAYPRTQSSIAVCGRDARQWTLVNASPDLRAQLAACPALAPGPAVRESPLRGIVLVDAQLDHTAGLLLLRESRRALPVWCTAPAAADLTDGNPIFRLLAHYAGLEQHVMSCDGGAFSVEGSEGITWRAFAVPGRPPPFSPRRARPAAGDNVALELTDEASGRRLLYAPGLGAVDEQVWGLMQRADCLLVDGTFWSETELIERGVAAKRAADMGHLPQSGSGGMLEWLARLPASPRRILIHVNNTNPILDEDSAERATLTRAGIEVAADGLEITL
ncbi:MAG: pyrroloquinoline quinone biosynthesis protein PqqB [Gammaproteobacteria bacterium]|nr:pyrroloquinoline quinone biosynthesis protein PqqB [Gammaproteobacteria bacterium]